jgi:hypothetical protein
MGRTKKRKQLQFSANKAPLAFFVCAVGVVGAVGHVLLAVSAYLCDLENIIVIKSY